jgi:hypothetical protein
VSGAPGTAFGRPAPGLLTRLRPRRVDVVELREVADRVLPGLAGGGLRTAVLDRRGAGAVVQLEEDERRVRVHLGDLAEDMTTAGVPPTAEGMAAALTAWVAARPVTDAAAAREGLAVVDWADAGHGAVGWRVVVRRGGVAPAWTPSGGLGDGALERTRAAARARSAGLALDVRVEGPIALWSHPVAVLATAVLAAPGRLLAALPPAARRGEAAHVVVTPQRPVVCAGASVAARLAGQTPEDCLTVPWPALPDLRWV